MAADGSFSIRVSMNADSASNTIAKLDREIEKSSDTITKLQNKMDEVGQKKAPTAEYAQLTRELKSANAELYKLGLKEDAGMKVGADFAKKKDWEDLIDKEIEVYQRVEDIRAKMQALTDAGKDFKLGTDSAQYKNLGVDLDAAKRNRDSLMNQRNAAVMSASSNAGAAAMPASVNAGKTGINAMEGLATAVQAANVAFKTLQSGSGKVLGIIQQIGKVGVSAMQTLASHAASAAKTLASNLAKSTEGFSKLGKRILGLASRTFVFSVISSGLRSIREEMDNALTAYKGFDSDFLAQINSLKTALANLGASFISAFQPILSVVIPILTQLISWITTAVNAIGMFFAALTGHSTYKKLTADITAAGAAADSTGKKVKGAGDKAKKAALGLQSFDQLNNLTNNKSGSGSGGSGGSGKAKDFSYSEENLPITDEIKKLADELKNNPFQFGFDIADQISDQLESIHWEDIRAKALKVGDTLAQILNGVFANMRFATDLGSTLAQGVNTAFDALLGFIQGFNWTQAGVWWGQFFNAFTGSIDWDLITQTVTGGINGLIAAIQGFLTTISTNMESLGKNLGNTVQGIMTGINWKGLGDTVLMGINDVTQLLNGWNSKINWAEIADQMLQGVTEIANGMIMTPDGVIHDVWAENGKAVGETIQNFLNGLHEFVDGFPFAEFTASLSRWFQNAMNAIDFEELGDTINLLVTGIINSICDFLEDEGNKEAFLTALSDFFTGLDLAEIGQSLFRLAGDIWDLFLEVVDTLSWKDIGLMILTAVLVGLVTTNPIIVAVAAVGALLIALLGKLVGQVGEAVTTAWNGLTGELEYSFGQFQQNWETFWGGIKEGASRLWGEITGAITGAWEGLTTTLSGAWEIFSGAWDTFWGGINEAASTLWNTITTTIDTAWDGVKSYIDEVSGNIKTNWEGFWNGVHDFLPGIWDGIKTTVSDAIDSVHDTLDGVLDTIQGKWEEVWQAVGDFIGPIWDTVSDTVTRTINDVHDELGRVLDNIKTKWENIWGGMRDFLKGVINGIIGFINKMISGVESAINAVVNGVNGLSFDVPDWVPAIGGSHFGFSLSGVSLGRVPQLADGAVIRGGNPFMAILGDQPAGQTNIEAPLDTITQAVRSAQSDEIAVLQEQNTILRQILAKSGILSRDVFNAVVDENNSYIYRNGRSAFAY